MIILNKYPDILTVKDVMEILRVGKNTAYQLLNSGEIRSRKVGKKYLIPKKSVIDYINSIRYSGK